MMDYRLLVRRLLLRKERFISDTTLKEECKRIGIPYLLAIKYLYTHHYLDRIFRGFFYIPTISERRLRSGFPNFYEAIARGMEYKKVANWYFGLETGIKMNAITHEFFNVEYVVSDTIFRAKPIIILGRRVKFVKIKKELFGFGVIKKDYLRYSDVEKSLLDLIHLRKYNGRSDKAIIDELIEWSEHASKKKLKKYAKHYSPFVRRIAEELG
jgi:hypothetical protein